MTSETYSLGIGNHRIGIQVAKFSMMRLREGEGLGFVCIVFFFMKMSSLNTASRKRVCVLEENINSSMQKMNTKVKKEENDFAIKNSFRFFT